MTKEVYETIKEGLEEILESLKNEEPFLKKGHVFTNPNNPEEVYRLTRDVFSGEQIQAAQFEVIGGSEQLRYGEVIPNWLFVQLIGEDDML